MILYLWVNNYKHIHQTGFNLNSEYEFNFTINESQNDKQISGNLSCTKKYRTKLFHDNIKDLRAIIGENGAGKSTIIELLVQYIMTKGADLFDGFLVTDKYIFNRNNIDFGNSLEKLSSLGFKLVTNQELVNYHRDARKDKLKRKK